MSVTTIEERLATLALEAEISRLSSGWNHVRTVRHEDGSVTLIEQEEYVESWMSPREDDGNVACLVMEHRDYIDLDEGDSGIEEARDRWAGGWGYGDFSCDQTAMVLRYLSIFRPDIAAYEPRWEVTGCSQGDWAYGYGYVTRDDLAKAGYSQDNPKPLSGTLKMRARSILDQEVHLYGLYFAGEVYRATNLTVGEPIVAYGDHGAYVTGYEIEAESCGGFLGYDSLDDIAAEMSASPVVAA